jgi:glycosyltransferase involved in cell wall biosynthesis
VTPNYNYGQFLEETIRSVLLQGYPNLEYIIIDGGSTDNSVEIIQKYAPWLTYWVSEKDQGQASAINKGIDLATGKWFNWLNSDDILMPNSLKTLAELTKLVDKPKWISGTRIEMDEFGSFSEICVSWRYDPTILGLGCMSFPQDATFVDLEFMKNHAIKLVEQYHNVFDTIFHYQLSTYEKPLLTTAIFSAMRWHKDQKTANSSVLQSEQKAVLAYTQKLPLINRFILRLQTTRINKLVSSFLFLAVFYGVLPSSRDWKSAVFDRMTSTFKVIPARHALFF